MNILIKNPNSHENIIEYNKIKWELAVKNSRRLILVFIFVVLISIVYELFNRVIESTDDNSTLSLGSAFIFLIAIYLFQQYRSKKRFFKWVNWHSYKLKNSRSPVILEITDDFVRYEDFEIKTEMKWSAFSSYRFSKGYLFLIRDDNFFASTAIKKELIPDNDFKELMEFVKKMFLEKL